MTFTTSQLGGQIPAQSQVGLQNPPQMQPQMQPGLQNPPQIPGFNPQPQIPVQMQPGLQSQIPGLQNPPQFSVQPQFAMGFNPQFTQPQSRAKSQKLQPQTYPLTSCYYSTSADDKNSILKILSNVKPMDINFPSLQFFKLCENSRDMNVILFDNMILSLKLKNEMWYGNLNEINENYHITIKPTAFTTHFNSTLSKDELKLRPIITGAADAKWIRLDYLITYLLINIPEFAYKVNSLVFSILLHSPSNPAYRMESLTAQFSQQAPAQHAKIASLYAAPAKAKEKKAAVVQPTEGTVQKYIVFIKEKLYYPRIIKSIPEDLKTLMIKSGVYSSDFVGNENASLDAYAYVFSNLSSEYFNELDMSIVKSIIKNGLKYSMAITTDLSDPALQGIKSRKATVKDGKVIKEADQSLETTITEHYPIESNVSMNDVMKFIGIDKKSVGKHVFANATEFETQKAQIINGINAQQLVHVEPVKQTKASGRPTLQGSQTLQTMRTTAAMQSQIPGTPMFGQFQQQTQLQTTPLVGTSTSVGAPVQIQSQLQTTPLGSTTLGTGTTTAAPVQTQIQTQPQTLSFSMPPASTPLGSTTLGASTTTGAPVQSQTQPLSFNVSPVGTSAGTSDTKIKFEIPTISDIADN